MNKVKRRAMSALLVAVLVLGGIGVYIVRYIEHGAEVGDGTSHAWFTGFLLDDAHPYAFVVLVENAGGGLTNAGAVANTVLQAAVNK